MILIIGASGFIGSHVCSLFKKSSIPYIILSRKNIGPHQKNDENIVSITWPIDIKSLVLSDISTILYLSYAPILQSMSQQDIARENLFPISLLIERVKESNPSCHLIFISSQSAANNTKSKYGKMKFEAEELIKKSELPWTILKPGLVIGEGAKGLYGRIISLIRKSPIIPLIGFSDNFVQPLFIDDLTHVIKKIAECPKNHVNCEYLLADSPIPFHEFLRKVTACHKIKRFFLPVPNKLIYHFLLIIERLWKNAPVTTTNLDGLFSLREMQTASSWKKLSMSPTPVDDALDKILRKKTSITCTTCIPSSDLCKEAEAFFKILFSMKPSTKLVKRYIEAHQALASQGMYDKKVKYILENQLDVEALELVLRTRKSVLTKKLFIIIALAEADPIFSKLIINQKECRSYAFIVLGYHMVRSLYKRAKGHLILWRHQKCMMQ